MIKKHKILSIGDCNTEGISNLKHNSYPERIGNSLDLQVINCGYTMTTTREGLRLFNKYYDNDVDIVTIQFGLVDSWKTIKYSPYVLYYPNTFIRKISRKILKKLKKIAKSIKLNNLVGLENVVSIIEYENNIKNIIERINKSSKILLIETIPNKDLFRNDEIIKSNYKTKIYNQIFLEKSCANLLLWMYKKHVNKFGYKLFIELEKVMLSKYVKISNNDKIKIYLNSLFGKKI